MDIVKNEKLWVEKYRPQTVASAILPTAIKEVFQGYVNDDFIPNMILHGTPGIGKTTAIRAMLSEMKADYYFINGSMKGNIDTLRVDVADYASSVSFTGKRKYVLIDEADYLNPQSTQPALRGFIEEFSKNCGFILTCNYPAKLIQPIHSRCPPMELVIPVDEREVLAEEFFTRITEILTLEGIAYKPEIIAEIIMRFFPDWRKVINVLQGAVRNKTIDIGALAVVSNEEIRKLFGLMKTANFTKIREWAAQHGTDHPRDLFRTIYDLSPEYLTVAGQAQLAIHINNGEYQAAFVANQEINLVATLVSIMEDCEFKSV